MGGKSSSEVLTLNKNRVLNLLINHTGEYGAEDIGELLGLSKRTIQSFVQEYNEMGFNIESSKGKYHIKSYPMDFHEIKKLLMNKEIKKYIVYGAIKNFCGDRGWVDRSIFIDSFTSNCSYIIESHSTLNKIIRMLQDDGFIYSRQGKIYIWENPFESMDDNSLIKMLLYFQIMKSIYPRISILNDIFSKLLWESKARKLNFNKEVFSYPHKNRISLYDEIILENIEKSIYLNKPIAIDYKSSSNKIIQRKLHPSGIVYNRWKDIWYVIEERNSHDSIYRLDRIINAELLDEELKSSNFNRELYNISFGISNEPITDIMVKFEKTDFIYARLLNYIRERRTAVISTSEEYYILEDKVCGFLEFEKWVKGFGKSAICMKPEKLQDRIKDDLKLMAERYEL